MRTNPGHGLRSPSRKSDKGADLKCHTWQPAPAIATDYLKILRQFGCSEEMQLWGEGYIHGHAGRLLWDVDFLSKNYRFDNCLNVGGAPFLFEYLIRKSQPELKLVSLDLAPNRFPLVSKILRTDIIQLDIEQGNALELADLGKFQCIVFCEIFEHLRINLLRTVALLGNLLDQDGILYLTTPNGAGLTAWMSKLIKGRTGPDPVQEWRKLSQIGHMGHVREYSSREVEEVLREAGLRVAKTFFRRQSTLRGTVRSKIRETVQVLATNFVPSLGDEIGIVARRSARQ